jgi:hypothetical protein
METYQQSPRQAVAPHYMHYTFWHNSPNVRVTAALQAGLEELIGLLR